MLFDRILPTVELLLKLKSLFSNPSVALSTKFMWHSKSFVVIWINTTVSSVQFSSVAQSCLTLCDPVNRSSPGLPVHHQPPEFTQTYVHWSVMPSNHLILCHPLLLLPSIIPSIRVFSSESVLCIRWPKFWSFSFSISPSNEYSGVIYLRMDWLNLLAVQGTLKSLFQHHSSKASLLWCSAFFMVHICTWLLETQELQLYGPLLTKWCFYFLIHYLNLS